MNRGTQWATDHGVTKSQIHTTEHRTVGGKKSPIKYQEDFPGCPVVKSLPDGSPGTATREQPLLTATSEKTVSQRRPQHSQI